MVILDPDNAWSSETWKLHELIYVLESIAHGLSGSKAAKPKPGKTPAEAKRESESAASKKEVAQERARQARERHLARLRERQG